MTDFDLLGKTVNGERLILLPMTPRKQRLREEMVTESKHNYRQGHAGVTTAPGESDGLLISR